jgi:hypothetical protein
MPNEKVPREGRDVIASEGQRGINITPVQMAPSDITSHMDGPPTTGAAPSPPPPAPPPAPPADS